MRFRIDTPGRAFGKALVPLALLAICSGYQDPALASGGGGITGRVAATSYLEETVVFVRSATAAAAAGRAVVDQKGLKDIPHVVAITAGDAVAFQNSDGVDHSVFSTDHEGFNLGTFRPGETRTYTFKTPNASYRVLCSLHPEQLGYVFVGQNPYHAVVAGDGTFTINDVPPGDYQVAVWNSHFGGADQSVRVIAGGTVKVIFSVR